VTPPPTHAPPRRTVARRLLASYLVLLGAFAITMLLGYRDMRRAAEQAETLRSGLVPLQLFVGQALAEQNVLAAQLNHATTAKNPADVREWVDAARRTRPLTIGSARSAAERLPKDDPEIAKLQADALGELAAIQESAKTGEDGFAKLFDALASGDRAAAEHHQSDLVKQEADIAQRLRAIRDRTEAAMRRLGEEAHAREVRALRVLVGMSALTLLVGVLLSLYARRVLRPLGEVTARAKAVAAGDLQPREPPKDDSEIGELAETFETMVAAIRDARAEIVQAERLATIGKMAARITHEIRNPLSAIGLNLELLEGELEEAGPSAKEQHELVLAIKNETARLARISEQYLGMARRPAPELASESLSDLVAEIAAFVRPELDRAEVKLDLGIADDLPSVPLDEGLMRQALLNLIRNAREAMEGGGTLTIRVRAAAGSGIDVVVEDDGPGIPEDVRATIFDPFFTTKRSGTGIGLAVTREIVEAHRGTIACEPREGGGTRFVIHLPQSDG
jgi:signal transduction histidine kinase